MRNRLYTNTIPLTTTKNFYLLFYITLIITSTYIELEAQTTPLISNYTKRDYSVSNNNHMIQQDSRGILYFANEYGLLEFDGVRWGVISDAPNGSNIISLGIDANNRMYIGAQGDFGFIDTNNSEGLYFHSLLDKIPIEYRDFGDVWDIIILERKVVFQTWDALFIYENEEFTILKTNSKIREISKIKDQVIFTDGDGLKRLVNNKAELFYEADLSHLDIRLILPFDEEKLLIGTFESGLFIYANNTLKPFFLNDHFDFKNAHITCGHLSNEGNYIIGTSSRGLVIFNKNGDLLHTLSKKDGLINNEIRTTFSDRENNIWVASKKSIDYIELASSLQHLQLDKEEAIGIYGTALFNDSMLFATHNGLFSYPFSLKEMQFQGHMRSLTSISDINWNIINYKNAALICHSKGISHWHNGKSKEIYKGNGVWIIKAITNKPGYWLAGTYTGIVIFKEDGSELRLHKIIKGFNESSRILEIDEDNNIWIAHGYKGVYKVELSNALDSVVEISFYDENNGLPSSIYNNVSKIWGEVVITTQKGIFFYNKATNQIEPHAKLMSLLGSGHVKRLIEDPEGNIWFFINDKTGVLRRHTNGSYTIEQNPFNKLNDTHIQGFENLTFANNKITVMGVQDGLAVYDKTKGIGSKNSINATLRKVVISHSDSTIYNDNISALCAQQLDSICELDYSDNNLVFEFSACSYENIPDIKYKFFLQGYDSDWSSWQEVYYKEYTNLKEGDYLFRIKAMDIHGVVSDEFVYKFKINPPWYRSAYAYLAYLLLILIILFLLNHFRNIKVKMVRKNYMKQQRQLREIEHANHSQEKLKIELENKTQELTKLAISSMYKNEKLTELKSKLNSAKIGASANIERKISSALLFIEKDIEEEDWGDFELRFDQAHNNFIKNLKSDFPELTNKDLKLCAYLKMNMTSKEIAQLLNISVRGVENARYRVRKKMNLDGSDHLSEWLLNR